MKHTEDNIIAITSIFACASIGVSKEVSLFLAGPRAISFVDTMLGFALRILTPMLIENRVNARVIEYWLYIFLYALCIVTFAFALRQRTRLDNKKSAPVNACLLGLQMIIGLMVEPLLLIVLATEFAFILPRRHAIWWLGAQLTCYSLMCMPFLLGMTDLLIPLNWSGAIIDDCLQSAWYIVAFGIGYLAATERRGRLSLLVAHAELIATQHLLADTLRLAERKRIARNLHDAIGHHLTALSLHLELGLRQTGEQASASFHLSRQLAQNMLNEVRSVVTIERQDDAICLKTALDLLCSGIPFPSIKLIYDVEIDSNPALAHIIFRCVQEAITNTLRHANATMVEIELCKSHEGVSIKIVDNGNGNGARKLREGNGLRGMRERIEELDGTLQMENRSGQGFILQIWIPLKGKIS